MNSAPPGKLRIIAGRFKGRKIPVLSMKALRPTPDRVRETLFNWLQTHIQGARCLNFFAGTGILGFEALSRGAKEVIMIDSDHKIIHALDKVCDELNLSKEECSIVMADVLAWIDQAHALKPYDMIFLDPPFKTDLLQQSLQKLQQSPLLGPKSMIYTELDAKDEPPSIEGFEIIKSQRAGQVGYYLYKARQD